MILTRLLTQKDAHKPGKKSGSGGVYQNPPFLIQGKMACTKRRTASSSGRLLPVPLRRAQILLLKHCVEGILLYLHIDHDAVEARSSHRYLPFLASILPGGGRPPAVSADPYKVSDFYYMAAHVYLLLNSNPR